MKVRFRSKAPAMATPAEQRFIQPDQILLKEGATYDVHALSQYEGVTFLLIIDDTGMPTFAPAVLFESTDGRVDPEWVIRLFDGPVRLVLGPPFIAQDLQSYEAMVDQRRYQIEQLLAWIQARSSR